jgi:hypothetical protein
MTEYRRLSAENETLQKRPEGYGGVHVSARIGSGKIAGENSGKAQAREEVVHNWKRADGRGGKRGGRHSTET